MAVGGEHRLRPVALAALEHYSLEVTVLTLLSDQTNTLFRAETAPGEVWVLRVGVGGAVRHPRPVIESEMMFLEALGRDTDLRAPHPLRNRSGELVTTVPVPGSDETRTCVVFSWMPGETLAKHLSDETMERFGRYAAELHRFGARFVPPTGFSIPRYDSAFPYDRPTVLFESELVPVAAQRRCRAMADRVGQVIRRLARIEAPRIIHGDLYAWNALVDDGEIGVFDFEEMLWGWPVQDIAGTFFTLWRHERHDELLAAYKYGYEAVAEWPERQTGEIATFMAGRSLLLANDVLLQPEWRHEATAILEEGLERIAAVIGH